MGYWNFQASIESAQKALHRHARDAMNKSKKQKLALKTLRRKRPRNVPKRGRMMRQVLVVPESPEERGKRAVVCALLFWIIATGIALFAAGVPLKGAAPDSPWVGVAFLIGAAIGVLGGIIGYFSGNKRPNA